MVGIWIYEHLLTTLLRQLQTDGAAERRMDGKGGEEPGNKGPIETKSEKIRKSVRMKECNVGDMSDRGEAKQGTGRSVLLSH